VDRSSQGAGILCSFRQLSHRREVGVIVDVEASAEVRD
jgi:hypothetical protein